MIKVSRGFSKGNHKRGVVEHVVSFSPEGLYHLTGDHRLSGISHVMVAERDDGAARFYGAEHSNQQEAYREIVRAAGFEPVGFYKITKRDAPDKANGGRKPIGARAQQGQITVRAAGMHYWDKTVSQLLGVEPSECRTGEGFIEVIMADELQLTEPHDGQPARFYPPEAVEEEACVDEPFNGLTPAEAERLYLVIEEAAEVQHIAAKILRHGYMSYHPLDETRTPNESLLVDEMYDLIAALNLLAFGEDINLACEKRAADAMIRKLDYCHHQQDILKKLDSED